MEFFPRTLISFENIKRFMYILFPAKHTQTRWLPLPSKILTTLLGMEIPTSLMLCTGARRMGSN